MNSKLSTDNAHRLKIAVLAIDAAKSALSVLAKPTSTDPLLAEIAKDLVATVSTVYEKITVLANVTDTDVPFTDLPEWEDKGGHRNLKMTLQTLLATIEGH
jgi:hypothetical protein